MAIPGSAGPFLLARLEEDGEYQIERSLRFNSSDSAYCSRVPSTAGNRKTWTWAGWVKRSGLGTTQRLFGNFDSGGANGADIEFTSGNQIRILDYTTSTQWELITTAVYRDPSSWFHVLVALDTTQATSSNRLKLYINGAQVTVFGTATYPGSNVDGRLNTAQAHGIGRAGAYNADYFNGYLADIHFIDGQALDPSSFGEFDTNNVWQPKAYNGSYGTNGFHLPFSDNSTAAALGTDTSGNGNTWTVNNLSVTAGAGNDSLVDTPTSYGTDTGAGGEVRGNYATLNPLDSSGGTLSDGNLSVATPAGSGTTRATFGVSSGKWYWEIAYVSGSGGAQIGILKTNVAITSFTSFTADGYSYNESGNKSTNNSSSSYGSSYTTGDVIGVSLDLDAGTLVFYKNGVSQGTAFSSLTGTYSPAVSDNSGSNSSTIVANFGQRPFAYTAPSGFKALCDTNLPAPVVAKPNEVMDVVLYTGNGSARSITGLGFNPDFVWIKGRSGATDHALYDAVRGVQLDLVSNSTAAETTQTQGLTAFNSDGFSLGTLAKLNTNAATYAGWVWDAGSSTVTNTQGSISSQVRANASSGFSVVTYTGTGANATVGHGLGVAPGLVIVKRRNSTSNWQVRHTSIAAANSIQLNLTSAAASATTVWNSTAPSSTVFSVGTDATVNASGATYVAYCFAPVAGYSAFGSYTGNGSADGPFVYTGFRPKFLIQKKVTDIIGVSGEWIIWDSSRKTHNSQGPFLLAESGAAEGSDAEYLDFVSNGFKFRSSNSTINGSGATSIYIAFAESPFQFSRAR